MSSRYFTNKAKFIVVVVVVITLLAEYCHSGGYGNQGQSSAQERGISPELDKLNRSYLKNVRDQKYSDELRGVHDGKKYRQLEEDYIKEREKLKNAVPKQSNYIVHRDLVPSIYNRKNEGLSHSAHTKETDTVKDKRAMLDEAKLIGLNFAVQKQILETFFEKASQFANIFDITHEDTTKGIKKTVVSASWKLFPQMKKKAEETQYLSNLDGLLAKALHNLRIDAKIIQEEWIPKEFPSLFATKPNLTALVEWLEQQQQQELKSSEHRKDKAMMRQKHPYTKQLFNPELVNPILRELDTILEQMSTSTHRMEWRKKVEDMFDDISTNSPLKEQQLDQMNRKRVDYDSMYVRLAIVRATFHTGKIAYAEKQRLKKKKDAENQQEVAAAAADIFHQQEMVKVLVIVIKHMVNYAKNLEIARAQMEAVLRNNYWGIWDDNKWYKKMVEGYRELGFYGSEGYDFNDLAHGDMELFAQMLDKQEGYVPAVNGPELVLKYQLLVDAATVWKLQSDVIANTEKLVMKEEKKEEERQRVWQDRIDDDARLNRPGW